MDKLKSKTGCKTCLVRRKKCDEKLPKCGHCDRLGLTCVQRSRSQDKGLSSTNMKSYKDQTLVASAGRSCAPAMRPRGVAGFALYHVEHYPATPCPRQADTNTPPATSRASELVFSNLALFAHIFDFIIAEVSTEMVGITEHHLPDRKAKVFLHILQCSRVSSTWNRSIQESQHLQETLFLRLHPAFGERSIQDKGHGELAFERKSSMVNPIILSLFPSYRLHSIDNCYSSEVDKKLIRLPQLGMKWSLAACLTIERKRMPALSLRHLTGRGRHISEMLIVQLPHVVMDATSNVKTSTSEAHDALRAKLLTISETGLTLRLVHSTAQAILDLVPHLNAVHFKIWAAAQ